MDIKKIEESRVRVSWGPVAAIVVTIGIYFIAQFLGGLIAVIYPVLRGWSEEQINRWFTDSAWGQFLLVLCIEAITLGLLWLFLKRRQAGFKDIGLIRPRLLHIAYAFAGFVAYLPLYLGSLAIFKAIFPTLDLEQQQQIGFESVTHGFGLVLVFISLVVLPPLVEEIVSRGFLYQGLKTRLPVVWSAIITSIIFAAAHLQFGSGAPLLWAAAIDTLVLSFVLIYLVEKTNSLWPAIGLHMIKNGLAFTVLFLIG